MPKSYWIPIPKDSVSRLTGPGAHRRYVYSFARVSAVLKLTVDDYYHNGARREAETPTKKAARSMICPCITCSSGYWTNTLLVAGLQSGQPLFQSVNSAGTAVTGRCFEPLQRMGCNSERAKAGGFSPLSDVTLGGQPAITDLPGQNDGRLEHAQQMAGHESPRTTKLYDRTKDEITLSEVERITAVIFLEDLCKMTLLELFGSNSFERACTAVESRIMSFAVV